MRSRRLLGGLLALALGAGLALGPWASSGETGGSTTTGSSGSGGSAGTKKEPTFALLFDPQPWPKAFAWLAEVTGLPFVSGQTSPKGTFAYVPPRADKARRYTVPEVLDIMNDALLPSGYLLVRTRDRLALVQSDGRLDATLCPLVGVGELKSRGRTELVRVIVPLTGLDAKEAAAVLKGQLGPFGEVTPAAGQLIVRDTAGSVRQALKIVHALEQGRQDTSVTHTHKCQHVKADEARLLLEQLFGGPPKAGAKGRGFSLTSAPRTNTLHVRGPVELVRQVVEALEKIDAPAAKLPPAAEAPFLERYTVPAGQAEALAKILQETFGGSPGLKIVAVDASTLAVLAGPEDQIRIAKLVHSPQPPTERRIVFIPLKTQDARKAVAFLQLSELPSRASAPYLEADTSRNGVLVRGTARQVEDIKRALADLEGTAEATGGKGTLRVVTLEKGSAAALAEAVGKFLSRMRANPVRVTIPGQKPAPPPKPVAPPAKGAGNLPGRADVPINITAAGNKLIFASDDPEALALAQDLVRLLTRAHGEGELEVVRLRTARAVEVARTLDEVFNGPVAAGPPPGKGKGLGSAPGGRRFERIRVGADTATNSLLVRASPLDMLTVRRLVEKALDIESEGEVVTKSYILSLKRARAAEVAKVVQELYRNEAPSRRPAATVDERTNSVVLRCSEPMFQDIRRLALMLDELAPAKK
jgi:type II secretory pathway component GspD/PulD (secretin)